MEYSRLRKFSNGPTFSEVSMQEDMEALKNKIPNLFKKPYKLIDVIDKNTAASNLFGIQHFWKDLEYPLYYVAEIFKWKNMNTNIVFPVIIIHELNNNGTVRTKFFEITILKCLFNLPAIVAKLNSTTFNTRNIYFLDNCIPWIVAKEELDDYWNNEKS